MAITITDQPTSFAKVGQKLMIVATSTNVDQPNFRYVIRITDIKTGETIPDIIVPPNPQNRLMFDLSSVLNKRVNVEPYQPITGELFFIRTNISDNSVSSSDLFNCLKGYAVVIYEGYDVDGVFTIDTETEAQLNRYIFLLKASYKVQDGYKPDPNLTYSFDSTTSLMMGGRKPNTNYPYDLAGATPSNQRVFIPVRKSELDWGCLTVIGLSSSQSDYLDTAYSPLVRLTFYESDGTPNTASYALTPTGQPDIYFLNVFPANLNTYSSWDLRPSDFPNWRWYEVSIYDSTNTTRKSALYTFYPVDDDCRFENVRLAWWNMEIGGFDFFNFDKKNEESIEVERKRVKKVVGTYADTSFSFNTFDRELAEGMVNRVDYINITSGWLQEGEFEFLKSLIASQLVYIVNDDGTLTPVLVEENNYTARKIREAKQYNYSMRLRYSQQFM